MCSLVTSAEDDDLPTPLLAALPTTALGLLELHGKKTTVHALADTGAAVSVIQYDTLLRLDISATPLVEPHWLKMADDSRTACTHQATVMFNLLDDNKHPHSYTHTFLVMPKLAMPAILGRDFTRIHNLFVGSEYILKPGTETQVGLSRNVMFPFQRPDTIASRVLSCFIGNVNEAPPDYDDCDVYTFALDTTEDKPSTQPSNKETYAHWENLRARTDPAFHHLLDKHRQLFPDYIINRIPTVRSEFLADLELKPEPGHGSEFILTTLSRVPKVETSPNLRHAIWTYSNVC